MRKVSNSTVLITFYNVCREEVHVLGRTDLKQEKFDMHQDINVEQDFGQGPTFVSKRTCESIYNAAIIHLRSN